MMNTKNKKEINGDILKNKILQLNEAIFVKKVDLKMSDFIFPLLCTGIPLIGEIISIFIFKKHDRIACYLFITSFAVQISYVAIGFFTILFNFKKSYKPFSRYIVDDFIKQSDIQKNVNEIIKDIDSDILKKYRAFLSDKISYKEKRNQFFYGGLGATSLFSLIMLFINTSENIYDLLINNKPFDTIQFFIFIIPLLFSIFLYLEYKEIEKCKTVLSYLPEGQEDFYNNP